MRRFILACLLLISCSPEVNGTEPPEQVAVDADAVATYVRTCRKPNGAFGPVDQEYTDAAWNYPAVATLRLLGEDIPQPAAVIEHGLGYPRGHVGVGHWQLFHEHAIRSLLGRPIQPPRRSVELVHQGFEVRYYSSPFGTDSAAHFQAGGPETAARDLDAEKLGYYNLASLYYLLSGLKASNRSPSNPEELVAFIGRRQAPGGGFADVRTAEGTALDEDAHIAYTFFAVASLKLLDKSVADPNACAAFVHACQHADGTYRRRPQIVTAAGNYDIYEMWAALSVLDLLGQEPRLRDECRSAINALQNADGGFGDRPGWRSRLYSTYYAVAALEKLDGDVRSQITGKKVTRSIVESIPAGRFRIYQTLFKMPVCQPGDLTGLSKRGFNLLGLKSDKPPDALPLLAAIREEKLPLDVILTPEAYPHRLTRDGGLVLDHVGNFTLDPRWNEEQRSKWRATDEAGRARLPWAEYRRRVLAPLTELGGLCYPEQDFEQELAYEAYDEGGYNAVLAGFNWSPRDFIRVFPWRERYVDKLTPIADADAHGDLAKWSPQLDHVRHLFLAEGPTYEDFQQAVVAGRVVCVIAMPEGVQSGISYYGRPAAVDYIRQRVSEWQWWNRP